jgi:hypothetical protein
MQTQRANFKTISLTAANTNPIISGTAYTYNSTTGVISSVTFSGGRTIDADVQVGDTLIDVSTGGKTTITAINTDDDEFTIASGLSADFNGGDFRIHQNPNSNTALISAANRKIYSVASNVDLVPDSLIWRIFFVGGTSPTATIQWYGWIPSLLVWAVLDASVTASAGGYTVSLAMEADGPRDSTVTKNAPDVYPYVSALGGSPAKAFIAFRAQYMSGSNQNG